MIAARWGHRNRHRSTQSRKWTIRFAMSLLAAWACKCRHEAPRAAPPAMPTVTVAHPVEHQVVEWDEYTGHLAAVEFVEVRARVSGMIVSVPFQPGSIVKQGELLVEIDARPFQADLESRLAEEARALAQVQLAEIELRRIQEMPPEAAVPIERQRAEATLAQNQAVLAAARAAAESARLLVEWTRVTSPITGRISSRSVDPGNLITGGTGTGTLLTTIASIDPIYCWIDADERAVLKYQRLAREKKRVSAREAQIPFFMQLADETNFPHEGVIDFVDNRIDPATGTIRGRGILPNPEGFLTPGLFARVRVPGSGLYVTTLVPDLAVATDQNQRVLYIVGKDEVVEARLVKLGALFGTLRAIESGVDVSDRVIVSGIMQARPGLNVSVRETQIDVSSLSAAQTQAAGEAVRPESSEAGGDGPR